MTTYCVRRGRGSHGRDFASASIFGPRVLAASRRRRGTAVGPSHDKTRPPPVAYSRRDQRARCVPDAFASALRRCREGLSRPRIGIGVTAKASQTEAPSMDASIGSRAAVRAPSGEVSRTSFRRCTVCLRSRPPCEVRHVTKTRDEAVDDTPPPRRHRACWETSRRARQGIGAYGHPRTLFFAQDALARRRDSGVRCRNPSRDRTQSRQRGVAETAGLRGEIPGTTSAARELAMESGSR